MKRPLALLALVPLLLAAAPEGPGDPAKATVHVVKEGESLGGVASRAVVPRVLIIEANGLKPPYTLRTGQQLVIPRRRSHTVKSGETGFSVAYRYGVSWDAIATANAVDPKKPLKAGTRLVIPTMANLPAPPPGPAPAPLAPGAVSPGPSIALAKGGPRMAWPAPGKVLRGFKLGAHDGIDIAGAEGSAVRAVAAGKVLFAGAEPDKYGILVVIDHGNGWHTAYGKLQKVTVRQGARARAGERLGLVGNSGETPRTELHFELRRNNKAIDPELVLPER